MYEDTFLRYIYWNFKENLWIVFLGKLDKLANPVILK